MHGWDFSWSINIRGWQSVYTWRVIKAEMGDVWIVQIGERNSCIMNQCVRRKPQNLPEILSIKGEIRSLPFIHVMRETGSGVQDTPPSFAPLPSVRAIFWAIIVG